MLGQVWYHSTTRKYVIAFGAMFDDLIVRRWDKNNNQVTAINVPIAYAPKRHWAALLSDNVSRTVSIQLPRLGFAITNKQPDPSRKTSPLNQIVRLTADKNKMYSMYNAQPFKLTIELYATTKNADDMAQIDEQISYFFNQDFTQSLDLVPTLNHKWDIITRLVSLQMDDIYSADIMVRQAILWTWTFEMDVWYFGPIRTQGPIKRILTHLYAVPGSGPVTNQEVANTAITAIIETTPGLTANGQPTSIKADSIDWQNISADDDYGFCVDITEPDVQERYDPVSGNYKPINGDE